MDTITAITTDHLTNQIGRLSISGALRLFTELFPGQVCFSTSFSIEDQVILQHIAEEPAYKRIYPGHRPPVQRNLFRLDGQQRKIRHPY